MGLKLGADDDVQKNCEPGLRKKVEADPRYPRLLLAVKGAGYKLAVSRDQELGDRNSG